VKDALALLVLLTACALAFALEPAAAHAQAAQARAGQAYVRLLGGPSLVHAAQDVGEAEAVTATGLAYTLGLAVGGMVSEELALDLDLVFARANAADHDLLGQTALTGVFAGAGVTYFLLPADVFFAGSLGLSRSSVRSAPVRIEIEIPQSDSSELGFGLHAVAGKTWPLGDSVGVGAALSLLWTTASNPIAGVGTQRQLVSALAALAITFR
jgi:hypothetical protein